MRLGSWILTASVAGKSDGGRRLAVGSFDLDQEIVPVAVAALESLARPSLRPPDVDRLPRLVEPGGLFEEHAGPGMRVRRFLAVQRDTRLQHAHGVVLQNHLVVIGRGGDSVGRVRLDDATACGGS